MLILVRVERLNFLTKYLEEQIVLNIQSINQEPLVREDISEYVAQLQLHMALQARNLVPALTNNAAITNSRQQMLQETQAIAEKFVSRQSL